MHSYIQTLYESCTSSPGDCKITRAVASQWPLIEYTIIQSTIAAKPVESKAAGNQDPLTNGIVKKVVHKRAKLHTEKNVNTFYTFSTVTVHGRMCAEVLVQNENKEPGTCGNKL